MVKPDLRPLPEFDIFRLPSVQNSIEHQIFYKLRPIATLDSKSFIEFNFSPAKEEYLRLHEAELNLLMQITLEKPITGSTVALADWDKVSICNNGANSLFKQVEFWIGDVLIDPPHQTYPYKTYLEKFLGKSGDIKKTTSALGLWAEHYPDDPETLIKEFQPRIRPSATAKSKDVGRQFDVITKIHLPMFEQRSLSLIGDCKLKIRFIPNDPAFYVKLSAQDIRVKSVDFLDCYLDVEGNKVYQHIAEAHQLGLAKANARYFMNSFPVIPITINAGLQDVQLENIFIGKVPNKVFVMFVDHRAFSGSYTLNPFNFQNFGVNYLQLYADGVPIGGFPKTPNFRKSLYAREYRDLFKVTNQNTVDTCITLPYDKYPSGNNIFAFRSNIDLGGARALGFINQPKKAALRLHLKFDEALDKTITCLVAIDTDSLQEISLDRTIVHDNI